MPTLRWITSEPDSNFRPDTMPSIQEMQETKLVGFKNRRKGTPGWKLKQLSVPDGKQRPLNAQESRLNKEPDRTKRNVWEKKQRKQQGRKQKKRS